MFLDVVGVRQHSTNSLSSRLYFLGNLLGSARTRRGRLLVNTGRGLCYDGLGLGDTLNSYKFSLKDWISCQMSSCYHSCDVD